MHESAAKTLSHTRCRVYAYKRRAELGLSQARLARLIGLSRATINELETGVIVDLGVRKLMLLLDLLGLSLRAERPSGPGHGLEAVSRTASVSHRQSPTPALLVKALASGELPPKGMPHLPTMLDEAPAKFIVVAVEDAARTQGVPARTVWQRLLRRAHEMKSPRSAWARRPGGRLANRPGCLAGRGGCCSRMPCAWSTNSARTPLPVLSGRRAAARR